MSPVLVLDGHPNPASLTAALADSYAAGAEAVGSAVTRLTVRDLDFDPILHGGYRGHQPLEPDLVRAQELIAESAHLALFTPLWWGSTPALLKGFFDRVFEAGWAYHYEGSMPKGHFTGRSARLLLTTDSPVWYLGPLQGHPTKKQIARSTLRFTGFGPVRFSRFGPVRTSSAADRETWLDRAGEIGAGDARGLARGSRRILSDPFAIREQVRTARAREQRAGSLVGG